MRGDDFFVMEKSRPEVGEWKSLLQRLPETLHPHVVRKRNWIVAGVALAAIVLLLAVLLLRGGDADQEQALAPALTVTGAVATKVSWPDALETSGAIAPVQEAVVGSELSGQRLVELNANVGDVVTKGQVLARFNTDTLKAERAELYANWVQAEANRKRGLKLKEGGALSNQKIETYIADAAVAKARLEKKDLDLRYATIVAPDDGVVSARMAMLGAVSNSGAELFRVILKGQLEWRGDLTAVQLARAAAGQKVELVLPDGSKANARLRQVSPSLNEVSRMATAYADIEPGSHAHAGMYATGKIIVTDSPAISVPGVSVVIRDGRSYVFKLAGASGTSKAMLQEVKTGRHDGDNLEIVSGLAPGDHVAALGAGFLNDGDVVLIVPEPTTKP